jgi:hypothetical protein
MRFFTIRTNKKGKNDAAQTSIKNNNKILIIFFQ